MNVRVPKEITDSFKEKIRATMARPDFVNEALSRAKPKYYSLGGLAGAGTGALIGGAYGAANPGIDKETGKKETRLKSGLKSGLIGAGLGILPGIRAAHVFGLGRNKDNIINKAKEKYTKDFLELNEHNILREAIGQRIKDSNNRKFTKAKEILDEALAKEYPDSKEFKKLYLQAKDKGFTIAPEAYTDHDAFGRNFGLARSTRDKLILELEQLDNTYRMRTDYYLNIIRDILKNKKEMAELGIADPLLDQSHILRDSVRGALRGPRDLLKWEKNRLLKAKDSRDDKTKNLDREFMDRLKQFIQDR